VLLSWHYWGNVRGELSRENSGKLCDGKMSERNFRVCSKENFQWIFFAVECPGGIVRGGCPDSPCSNTMSLAVLAAVMIYASRVNTQTHTRRHRELLTGCVLLAQPAELKVVPHIHHKICRYLLSRCQSCPPLLSDWWKRHYRSVCVLHFVLILWGCMCNVSVKL